jgi:glutaminyl-peptide cyclotransferase
MSRAVRFSQPQRREKTRGPSQKALPWLYGLGAGLVLALGLIGALWLRLRVSPSQVLLSSPGSSVPASGLALENILPPDGTLLKEILIPRPPGSQGSRRVREAIKRRFSDLSRWAVEEDMFETETPIGAITFCNLILTFKTGREEEEAAENARQRVILAAHYDSKILEGEMDRNGGVEEASFIGATDAGWSCALLVELALALTRDAEASSYRNVRFDLQLVFFDGEEAYKAWSPADSLYGSRHLAQKWASLPAESYNRLDRIHLFVLLDLVGGAELGTGKASIYSLHRRTRSFLAELVRLETELAANVQTNVASALFQLDHPVYQAASLENAIEDDHTPFLALQVPILHLIPMPFPKVWHTAADDVSALDRQVCARFASIMYKFTKGLFIPAN